MLGFLSFLAFLCGIAFVVSLVLLFVRLKKRKPWKPCAIVAAVAVVCVLGLSMPISQLYVPAEKPEETGTPSAVDSTANVENPVDNVENQTTESGESANPEHSVAPDATSAPEPVQPDTAPAPESEQSEASPAPSSAPAESEPASESIAEAYKTDVIVASKMILDRFISGYSVSLAEQNWTVADFDSDGAVIAMADVKFKSTKETARALVVLTPVIEGDEFTEATPHYVAVGETVYGDDGYCDDVFSSIQEALDSFGGSEG